MRVTAKGERTIMKTNKVSVGVNGYGVIGKRVADAVRLQPDMVLVGVSDIISD
jgi:glyceraldehyde-3-phosphate dehydrogenase/erythrose-4-phosphate dehydrogenase